MVSLRQRKAKPPSEPTKVSQRLKAKKQSPSPRASSSSKRKQQPPQRKLLYRKTEPLFLECPKSGEKVWIAAANLQDIRQAEKKGKSPFNSSRKYLVKVSAPNVRTEVYARAALALQKWEESLLPTYGGRPWKVVVKVQDPIPTETKAAQRNPYFRFYKGRLEIAVWPHILQKIPDPPRFPGFSRKTVGDFSNEEVEEVEEVASEEAMDAETLHEREISVISEMAVQERWRVPFPRVSTKWTSPLRENFTSRKSAWERATQLAKQEVAIDKALHGFGGNGKPLTLKPFSLKTVLDAGSLRFQRDGLWVVGQEEEWQRERLNQDGKEHVGGTEMILNQPKGRRLTGLNLFLKCRRREHQAQRLTELKQEKRVVPGRFVMNLIEDSSKGQSALKNDRRDIQGEGQGSPVNVAMGEQPVANPHPSQQRSAPPLLQQPSVCTEQVDCSTENEEPRGLQLTTALHNDSCVEADEQPIVPSLRAEDAKSQAEIAFAQTSEDKVANEVLAGPSVASTQIRDTEKADAQTREMEVGVQNDEAKVSFTLREAETELRWIWKSLTEVERQEWETRAIQQDADAAKEAGAREVKCLEPNTTLPDVKDTSNKQKKDNGVEVDVHRPVVTGCSAKFCLPEDKVKLCYEASVQHYDQVMLTVRTRDLTRELQGGFDLFRERGRGRFDMELPVFDTTKFKFLTDLKSAPWMPIVRKILGKDVVLIHKGIFLALPGAEKQPYHQDGLHLTSQYQKPCHAINVFIPLVDLTNQGTEFCLGSHILGNEDLENEFTYTPNVVAGTPVIFDYRLGHRGLANTSGTLRPVVYCTYAAAADGKEFRDSVNFSRKRYRALGDLVKAAPSREERARKREKKAEEVGAILVDARDD